MTDVPVFNLKTHHGYVRYVPLNDIHIGSPTFDKIAFEKTLDYVITNNKNKVPTYISLDADAMENITPNCAAQSFEQAIMPTEQKSLLLSYLKPLKGHILFAHGGNHMWRTMKRAYFDLMLDLCRELGIKYIGIGGYVRFDVGKQQYLLAVQHGSSGAKNWELEIRRMERNYPDAELLLMGHDHSLHFDPQVSLAVENLKEVQKIKYYGRTGNYLGFADYARNKNYEMKPTGSLNIKFSSEQHLIEGHRMIYINGERMESVAHTGRKGT